MKKLIAISVILFLSISVFSQVETEAENSDSTTFKMLDSEPQFPGGDEAKLKYISENISYPTKAKEEGIQGTVYVTFIVEKDGSITNAKILRGIGGGCDEEVIRLIEEMPNWIPAKQNDKNVRVQFNMPVKFVLDSDKASDNNEVESNNVEDKSELDEDPIFVFLEDNPEFVGGDKARIKFIQENIVYPQKAIESGVQGTVFLTFVVEKDGSLTNVKVLRGIGYGCDEEALRVIKSMPKWKPGKQRGNVVRARFNIPVKFVL
jgi:TonB family protein